MASGGENSLLTEALQRFRETGARADLDLAAQEILAIARVSIRRFRLANEVAEDIVQDRAAYLMSYFEAGKGRVGHEPGLVRAAVSNKARDQLRRKKRLAETILPEHLADQVAADASEAAGISEVIHAARRHIEAIPIAAERHALRRVYLEDASAGDLVEEALARAEEDQGLPEADHADFRRRERQNVDARLSRGRERILTAFVREGRDLLQWAPDDVRGVLKSRYVDKEPVKDWIQAQLPLDTPDDRVRAERASLRATYNERLQRGRRWLLYALLTGEG